MLVCHLGETNDADRNLLVLMPSRFLCLFRDLVLEVWLSQEFVVAEVEFIPAVQRNEAFEVVVVVGPGFLILSWRWCRSRSNARCRRENSEIDFILNDFLKNILFKTLLGQVLFVTVIQVAQLVVILVQGNCRSQVGVLKIRDPAVK